MASVAAAPTSGLQTQPPEVAAEDAPNDGGAAIDTFSGYLPTALPANLSCQGPSHTSPACESALLASVSAPRASNESSECLLELANSGALSPLQLEGSCLAIQRHNRLLFDTSQKQIRAGFFIGDAAGIGKGRQIAAVLRDSMCRGRVRHLWVSVSRELALDAARDLKDLNCNVAVHDGTDLLNQTSSKKGLGAGGDLGKGVLFVTYSLLVSGQGRRMEEIIQWLAGTTKTASTTVNSKGQNSQPTQSQRALEQTFDGVIVFDEAHKAKNLDADTHTAKLVLKIQERLSKARVLYCSATGVSDIKHMVYANRMGLWGLNTLYPTFENFQHTLNNRGMGSLEMLALEMKQMGTFVARTLSWDGAEFETLEIPLDENQTKMYNGAVKWWFMVKKQIDTALRQLKMTSPPKTLWRAYWSAHQRFFREMAICAKIGNVVKEAKALIEKDCAIIVGLQSTGEASTQTALEELAEQILVDGGQHVNAKIDFEDILLPSLVSTARSIMTSFVKNHFPVAQLPLDPPKVPPLPPNGFPDEHSRIQYMYLQAEAERIKKMPPPAPIPELVGRRRAILDHTKQLELPPNPLDDLIDQLGGEGQVAELTGRSGRILRYKDGSHYHYCRRIQEQSNQKSFGLSMPKSSEDFDKLNIVEKKKFMDGRKSVAIISDAASTGISLHAAAGSGASHKRRVHFTIELPWAADKAIQQLGRSHRSGQLSAPIYKMVVTDLGGERRFGAAVSKRMANLGALTKGDRRAATGSDLSEFDIDSAYGRRALTRVYQSLLFGSDQGPTTAPSRHGNAILVEFAKCAMKDDPNLISTLRDETMQRVHALSVARQALEDVDLTSSDTSKSNAQVKVFLNRIAGLPVEEQKLVFSLFMSTLDDVVADAKATGEFEGSVEDVIATHIELDGQPETLAVDNRSGALTKLTRINLDRGISLKAIVRQSLDDASGVLSSEDVVDAKVAESGFYVSKRTIAGRQLVLYAKRKVEPSTIPSTGQLQHDPLGLMVITRPNTGKNPCEMSSRDLKFKYRLLLSSHQFCAFLNDARDGHEEEMPEGEAISENESPKESMVNFDAEVMETSGTRRELKLKQSPTDLAPVETKVAGMKPKLMVSSISSEPTSDMNQENDEAVALLRSKAPQFTKLWDDSYSDSNGFDHNFGLAPRRSRLGLVTGAVLHILPALEKAVIMRRQSERALRVARVEIPGSNERIVGIRFPLDKDVVTKLKTILNNLLEARKTTTEATMFKDEGYEPVCEKSKSWVTTERKTMRSFFGVSSSPNKRAGSKRKETPSSDPDILEVYSPMKGAVEANVVSTEKENKNGSIISRQLMKKAKRTSSIKSFFAKK